MTALSVILASKSIMNFLFHLHLSVHSCRSRQSTGGLPERPLLVYQQGYHASQSTCVQPSHQMAHTEEADAKGSRHPSDYSMHTQSGLLCRLGITIQTLQVLNEM